MSLGSPFWHEVPAAQAVALSAGSSTNALVQAWNSPAGVQVPGP
jgi:hypothetical protein